MVPRLEHYKNRSLLYLITLLFFVSENVDVVPDVLMDSCFETQSALQY